MRAPERNARNRQAYANQARHHLDVALTARLLLGRAANDPAPLAGQVVEVIVVVVVEASRQGRDGAARVAACLASREKLVVHVFDQTAVGTRADSEPRGHGRAH
jgi:hypothetical protein